ncbi:MAG: alpha/beta fold hydrolase [Geminicoccaceae bacterium]
MAPARADLRFDWLEVDGLRLRFATTQAADPSAWRSLYVFSGRTEFIEKYQEGLDDWCAMGFRCAILDWRGQGGSDRLLSDRVKGHVESFDDFQADADAFIEATIASMPRPRWAFGHSMGGHNLLRLTVRRPDLFDGVVLSSPMLGLVGSAAILKSLRPLLGTAVALGLGGHYGPGQGPTSSVNRAFENNVLTSCRSRYEIYLSQLRANPHLELGGVTWGWLYAATTSMNRLARDPRVRSLPTPVLVLRALNERIVDNEAIRRTAERLPHAELLDVAGAEHEILLETDERRGVLLAAMDRFCAVPARLDPPAA